MIKTGSGQNVADLHHALENRFSVLSNSFALPHCWIPVVHKSRDLSISFASRSMRTWNLHRCDHQPRSRRRRIFVHLRYPLHWLRPGTAQQPQYSSFISRIKSSNILSTPMSSRAHYRTEHTIRNSPIAQRRLRRQKAVYLQQSRGWMPLGSPSLQTFRPELCPSKLSDRPSLKHLCLRPARLSLAVGRASPTFPLTALLSRFFCQHSMPTTLRDHFLSLRLGTLLLLQSISRPELRSLAWPLSTHRDRHGWEALHLGSLHLSM